MVVLKKFCLEQKHKSKKKINKSNGHVLHYRYVSFLGIWINWKILSGMGLFQFHYTDTVPVVIQSLTASNRPHRLLSSFHTFVEFFGVCCKYSAEN